MREDKNDFIKKGAQAFLTGQFIHSCKLTGWRLKYWRIGWSKAASGEITKDAI